MGGEEHAVCAKNFEQIKKSLCSTTELKGVLLEDDVE